MKTKTINVLGVDWKVTIATNKCKPILGDDSGYTDNTVKECVVYDQSEFKNDKNALGDLDVNQRKTTRHELIHAFLFESGLYANSSWADNEEMVDWIAYQFPKLAKAFKDAGCDY